MSEISVKIVVDDKHVGDTEEISRKLGVLGLKIENAIPEIGAIFGTAEEEVLPELSQVEGVLQATEEHVYQLPPLSEKIPQ